MAIDILDTEIIDKISTLNKSQKESILTLIKSFTDSNEKRISKKQYNIEITASENRIKKGKFVSHDELEKQSSKW